MCKEKWESAEIRDMEMQTGAKEEGEKHCSSEKKNSF